MSYTTYYVRLRNRVTGRAETFTVWAESGRDATRDAFRMLFDGLQLQPLESEHYADYFLDEVSTESGTRIIHCL